MRRSPLHKARPAAAEAAAVGGEAVLLEWLAAVRGSAPDGKAALRAWARQDPAGFRAAFAAFARIGADVADAAAGWLLGGGVRPDDVVLWTGDADDPCLAGLAAIGGRRTEQAAQATMVRDRPPVWPPADAPEALRPPVSGPDEG